MPLTKLAKYIANLGYGSRRQVEQLIEQGGVARADGSRLRDGDSFEHEEVRVNGEPLDPPAGSVIMMHKPIGYVCSTKDVPPLVYELLPPRFLARTPVMATVGRLDRDTSGLLLLTDDGKLNHQLTSPRSHVTKTYVAQLAEPLRGDEIAMFASGTMMLDSEKEPLAPATLEPIENRLVRVTLHEGRYHQVRRMFAATGNHVEQLQRVAIGGLALADLEPGQWRVLNDGERAVLLAG